MSTLRGCTNSPLALVFAFLLGMTLLTAQTAAAAQATAPGDYPNRPIELLVAYAPGGGQDLMFRLLSRYAESYLGQRIVVSNRIGGGNTQAKLDALAAKPDGYVLGTWVHGLITDSLLRTDVHYSPRDVRIVCIVGMDPHVITISKKMAEAHNIKDFKDLLTYIKANSSRTTIGAGGNWTGHDFLRLKIEEEMNVQLVRLPFLGGLPALRAVAAGNCDIATPLLPEIVSMLGSGTLMPLAVAYPRRVPQLPDIPTTAEFGLAELMQTTWRAVSVPLGTPDEIVAFLESVFRNTVEDPKFIAAARKQGIIPHFMGTQEATAYIAKEFDHFRIKTEEWGIRVQ